MKILSVLDGKMRLTQRPDGLWESGNWYNAPKDCDLIEVFQPVNGRNVCVRAGSIVGEIKTRDKSGKRRKIFVFADEPARHSSVPPEHFNQSGCAQREA